MENTDCTKEAAAMSDAIKDYVLTEVCKYLAEEGYVSKDGDSLKLVVDSLNRELVNLTENMDRKICSVRQDYESVESDVEDIQRELEYGIKDTVRETVDDELSDLDFAAKILRLEDKVDTIYKTLNTMSNYWQRGAFDNVSRS